MNKIDRLLFAVIAVGLFANASGLLRTQLIDLAYAGGPSDVKITSLTDVYGRVKVVCEK